MKKIISILLISLSFSGYAMRCGNSLVNEGDRVDQLISLCGKPDAVIDTDVWGDHMVAVYHQEGGMTALVDIRNGIITDVQFTRD